MSTDVWPDGTHWTPDTRKEREAKGWRYGNDGCVLNRVSPVVAAMHRRALLEVLARTAWTHAYDQSFQDTPAQPRGASSTVHYIASMLVQLPVEYRPSSAWIVSEPHPSSGRWHAHGFWQVSSAKLSRGWWRAVKEMLGERWGWARLRPFHAGTLAALAKRLDYPTAHAVKKSPTRFWDRMALMTIEDRRGGAIVRYSWRNSWWSGGCRDGVLTMPGKER